MEPKTLPPTLRTKKRYIVYNIISEKPIEYPDFIDAIWDSCFSLFGEMGTSNMRLWNISNLYNDKEQKGVVKCEHIAVEKVRSCLASIQVIGETKAIVKVIGVTGTLKNAQQKYLKNEDI